MPTWLYVLLGAAALLDAFLVWTLCRASARSERASFAEPSSWEEWCGESKGRVERMQLRQVSKWRETL